MTGPDDLIRRGDVLRIFEPETSMVRRRICDDVRAIPSVSIAAPPEVQAERDAALAGVLSVVRAEFAKWIGQMDPKAGERSRVEWNLATGLRDRVIEAMTRILASVQPDTEAVDMAKAAAFSAGFEAGQRDEREACAALASVRADSLDDAIKWGGGKVYLASLKGGLIELRNLAAAIRKRGEDAK